MYEQQALPLLLKSDRISRPSSIPLLYYFIQLFYESLLWAVFAFLSPPPFLIMQVPKLSFQPNLSLLFRQSNSGPLCIGESRGSFNFPRFQWCWVCVPLENFGRIHGQISMHTMDVMRKPFFSFVCCCCSCSCYCSSVSVVTVTGGLQLASSQRIYRGTLWKRIIVIREYKSINQIILVDLSINARPEIFRFLYRQYAFIKFPKG